MVSAPFHQLKFALQFWIEMDQVIMMMVDPDRIFLAMELFVACQVHFQAEVRETVGI